MAYNGKGNGKGKGKGKEASVEFMFTEALRKSGDYAVVGDEIAEWTGCRWKPLSPAERNRVAASWIEKNDPSSLTSGKVASCAGIAASLLPELSLAGVGPIVATRKAWLMPTEDGRFRAMAPDRSLGVTHACELDLPDDGSGFYTPSPVPEDSDFGRFLVTSLPDPDLRRAVQQFCGYTLLPTVNVQTAHVWIGEGGNGKGLLKALLGRFHPRTAAIVSWAPRS
jgi:putative DNA primase/helicase